MTESIIHSLRMISIVWCFFWLVCFFGPLVFILAKFEEIKRRRKAESMIVEDNDIAETAPSFLLAVILYNPFVHLVSLILSITALVQILIGHKTWIYVGISCFCFVLSSFILLGSHLKRLFLAQEEIENK